jgi:hypothetical protein
MTAAMTTQEIADAPVVARIRDRQRTGERLLRSAQKLSFDPMTEIDWDTPLAPDRYFEAPHRCSLYGTTLWDGLTEEQRIELTKHEVASIASVGIWFEEILMQMLLRYAYDRDATRSDIQWTLTEIGDECRHSVMFAKMIAKFGAPAYGVSRLSHELGRLFKTTSDGVLTFAGTMYVEEILDAFQREAMDDDALQPLVRQVSRIHVIEEARHISYAREESLRAWAGRNRVAKAYDRLMLGLVIERATSALVNPRVYATVGLDPQQAAAAAEANPHWRATKRWAAEKVLGVFRDAGLIGPENEWLLRHAGVV